MTRDEALTLLGLYRNATADQVRARHSAKRGQLSQMMSTAAPPARLALTGELARLDLALDVATGKAPEDSSATQPTVALAKTTLERAPVKRHRGKLLLLAIAIGLAGFAITVLAGQKMFDKRHNEPAAQEVTDDAERASAQWLSYLSRAGIADTPEGRKAADALNRGAGAKAAGDKALAQREFNTAWQAYVNAFRAEGDAAKAAWKNEIETPVKDKLQGFFPFDARADKDADAAVLSALVSPAKGALWAQRRRFEAIADVELAGTRFFTLPEKYKEFVAACEKLRDALYAKDGATIEVGFGLRIISSITFGEVELTFGGRTCKAEMSPDFITLIWRQNKGGCVLEKPASGGVQLLRFEFPESPWGLLHVLALCEPAAPGNGTVGWRITAFDPRGGQKLPDPPPLDIMCDRPQNPFDSALYAALRLP